MDVSLKRWLPEVGQHFKLKQLWNGSLFLWAFSGYENLGYLYAICSWFHPFLLYCLRMRAFWKKFSKICFWSWVEKCDFPKNIKNYSTLTMSCDQTTWPIANQMVSVERQSPYISFGNLGFKIGPSVGSQWPYEHHGPLQAMAKNEWYVHNVL